MRTWEYVTTWKDVGKTLNMLLQEAGFSKKEISRQKFLQDGIVVDGTRCRITKILKEGQQVLLQFKKEERDYGKLPAEKLPVILYEDKDILILNKPSGCPTHPCRGHYMDNLGLQAAAHCERQGEEKEGSALSAVTHYRVLDISKKERMSLVEFFLDTGRTHQIRVHMASKGHPIVGDVFYGQKEDSYKRLCLHAGKINITGKCLPGQEFPVNIQKFY